MVLGETLPYAALLAGFDFEGTRVPLLAPQGIFKPAILNFPLSITTPEELDTIWPRV